MATNTSATSQNHNGTGSQANFAISFPFLLNSEIEVTVGGVLKTLGTHYNIVGSEVQFTSGNLPASGTANVVFNRDTNISTKRVDFEDGSVLTEADLDNNVNQVLFAQQELSNDYVKRDGTQTVTGNLVFEGSADDANETTLSITNPTADRTITVPDRTGTIITSGDTGTVTNTMLAGNSVDSSKIIDGSIVNADVNASAAIAQSKLNIANATTSAAGYQSAADKTKLDGIESNATQDQTASEIRTLIASDPLTATHLAANSVDSSELVDGSVDHSHLSDDCVDGDNVQDDSIDNEHIAANAVRVNEIKDGEITSAKLNPSTVITSSEQGSATTNDTSFLTSAAADARFFNISSGDTIKDGQTFPDNDTTIATTAAINDRIIDIVNDVGGFDIVESEQHFPDTNPQGQAGSAAVLSIKAATTNLVPSGTTVTIVNGNIADNANITITGVTSTIPSGFGFIVESTSTLHTYTFHRLVPKATEVTTVAGKAVEIGRLGTADAVADMAILGTTDVVADMNTLATADIVSDMNTLATTDVVNDMNTLAVTSVINNMDTVATNVTNVNNVGNNITNVNNLTNSTGANQTFTVTVQNVSGNKYFIDGVQTPVLKLARGKTYTFNLADSSNSGHPLAFRDSSDNAYTTGVTTNGTAGSSGATVVIVVAANAPSSLKYYCTSHGNAMGNTINVIDDNVGAVAGALTNVNFVGGSITNVNNVGGSISNVNTVANNINNVNDFFDKYRVGANNPTTSLDTGDLFFNTTSNSLKVYTGSAWVDGVTATGNFAVTTGNTFTGSNNHNDNVKSIYGTGSDLEIFHDGNNSLIRASGTGDLNIYGDEVNILNKAQSEFKAKFITDGAVELYYDNSKKLETNAQGIVVSGDINLTYANGYSLFADQSGNLLRLGDNIKLQLGNAGDLEIYHSGTHSFIENNTGHLLIRTDNELKLQNGAGTENMAKFIADGAVELYHNNSKKFETTSGGVTVTGSATISSGQPALYLVDTTDNPDFSIKNADGVFRIIDETNSVARFNVLQNGTVDIAGNLDVYGGIDIPADSQSLRIGASADLQLFHNGSASVIRDNGTGNLQIAASAIQLTNNAITENMLIANPNGAVELYYDNVKKFETTSSGILVTGGIHCNTDGVANGVKIGAGNDLILQHNGTNSFIDNNTGDLYIQTTGSGDDILIESADDVTIKVAGSETAIQATGDGAVDLYHDNSKKFETTSSGVTVTGTVAATSYTGDGSNLTGINTDLVSDTSPQLGGTLDTNGNVISFDDATGANNNRLKFGTGDDLHIYHNGTDSTIRHEGTGKLVLQSTTGNIELRDNAEDMIVAKGDGAVELYYDNSKKFQTITTGVDVFGFDIRFSSSGGWSGEACKIQHHNNSLYIQAGSAGHRFRRNDGNDAWVIDSSGHLYPASSNTYDIGTSTYRVRNIYTNDLNLSNEGSSNDVDGTWGSYTIQEGAEDLFLINKRNGKKYKFNLTEVL